MAPIAASSTNIRNMQKIELINTLPAVFAGADVHSEVWHCHVTLERGRRYLVTAESGTGKSSMCSYIYGHRRDYSGTIAFENDVCALNGKTLRPYSNSQLFLADDLESDVPSVRAAVRHAVQRRVRGLPPDPCARRVLVAVLEYDRALRERHARARVIRPVVVFLLIAAGGSSRRCSSPARRIRCRCRSRRTNT